MRRLSRLIPAVCCALLGLAGAARAQDAKPRALVPAAFSASAHDINRAFLEITNRGLIGADVLGGSPGNFPIDTPNRYIFGSGLWIGGIGDFDADGVPDTLTTIGYNPTRLAEVEWIEGAVATDRNDPLFRVLRSTDPDDQADFPAATVADQETFAIFDDRFSIAFSNIIVSIPLGVDVRQRTFAFNEPGIDATVFFQWDVLNISDRIRETGHEIESLWAGIVLDPDIGFVSDDTATRLTVDGEDVLLIWDVDFQEGSFTGTPGFLAVVPLDNPGGRTNITQLSSAAVQGVRQVPLTDPTQYRTLAGLEPQTPTITNGIFDLRALIGWGEIDLPIGGTMRTAAAYVWADVAPGLPSFRLEADDPTISEDAVYLSELVAAVRAARQTYDVRLANLTAVFDFPGEPPPAMPSEVDRILQNYPNPFTDATTIEYRLTQSGRVGIQIFDIMGRLVVTLVDGAQGPGELEVSWDGTTDAGLEAPAGVYIIRLTTPNSTSVVRALKVP